MIYWKCTVVLYNIENGSSTDKHFPKYGPSNIAFHFFQEFIYSCFHEAFVKNFMRKLFFFIVNFPNSYQIYYNTDKNDKKNRHQRIKKQPHYECLVCLFSIYFQNQ